jgi:hypothetical protein
MARHGRSSNDGQLGRDRERWSTGAGCASGVIPSERGNGAMPSHVVKPVHRSSFARRPLPGAAITHAPSKQRSRLEQRPQLWFRALCSTLVALAVAFAAAAPAHASGDGHAETPARADTLPTKRTLDVSDTGTSLSKRYYGSRDGALTILSSNGLKHSPPSRRIVASKRYQVGDTIVIPRLPKASIEPPRRSNAAPASAGAVFSVPGAAGAGPARYDRVLVERFGPASARTVLVLVPGKTSGAGAFAFVARDLARRVRGLQVWAVDRREQAMEDTSVVAAGDPDQTLAYYLRGQPVSGRRFSPPPVSEVRFMAKWGLGLLVGDLRRVVRKARAGGRRVILGGHSMGAAVAEAYASWDFAGRAGYRAWPGSC